MMAFWDLLGFGYVDFHWWDRNFSGFISKVLWVWNDMRVSQDDTNVLFLDELTL